MSFATVDTPFVQNSNSQGQSPAQQYMAQQTQNQVFQMQYPQMMTLPMTPGVHAQQSSCDNCSAVSMPQLVSMPPGPSSLNLSPMMSQQQVMMPYVTTPTQSAQQYFNFVQPQMGNPQINMCHPLEPQVNQPLLKRCSSDESSVSSASSSIMVMPAISPGYTAFPTVNYQTAVPDVQIQNQGERMNDLRPTTQDNVSMSPEQINLASEIEQNLRIMPRPRSVNVSPRVDGRNLAPMLKGDPVHGWGAQPRRHVPMVPPQYRYRRNPRNMRSKKKYGYRSKQNKIEQVKGNLERKFGSRGILVPQDSLLRGRTVVRVHVKKYEPLCKIEEALSMIDNHPDISICRISLPVSMKNPFQMKGFLVYVQVEDLVQVQLTQAIFRLFAEFQKCEVALQSQSNNNAAPKVKSGAACPRVSDTQDSTLEPKELEPIKEEPIKMVRKKSNLVLEPIVDDMQKLGSKDDDGTYYPAIFGDSDDECDILGLDPPGMMRKHSSVAAA